VIEHLGRLEFLHARENVILLGLPCVAFVAALEFVHENRSAPTD
jgi:hypothetical protein